MGRHSQLRHFMQLLILLTLNAGAHNIYDLSSILETRQGFYHLVLPAPSSLLVSQQSDTSVLLSPDFSDSSDYSTVEIVFPDKNDNDFTFIALLLEDEASPETINLLPETCMAESILVTCYTDEPYLKLITLEPLLANQQYRWVTQSAILPSVLVDKGVSAQPYEKEKKTVLTHSKPWRQPSLEEYRTVEVYMFGTGAGGGDNWDDKKWRSLPLKSYNNEPVVKDPEFYLSLKQALEGSQLLTGPELEDWCIIHDISMESLLELIEQVQPNNPVIIARRWEERQQQRREEARQRAEREQQQGEARRRLAEQAMERRQQRQAQRSTPYSREPLRMRLAARPGYDDVFSDPGFIKRLTEKFESGGLQDQIQIDLFCHDNNVSPEQVKCWISKQGHTHTVEQAESPLLLLPGTGLSMGALQPPGIIITPPQEPGPVSPQQPQTTTGQQATSQHSLSRPGSQQSRQEHSPPEKPMEED